MNKKVSLSVNILIFSIGSFATKFLSFFLVPFYTNFLSTAEYGTIDLIINTAALLVPIFTLVVYDGVMRFSITDKDDIAYFVIGIVVISVGITILGLVLFFINLFFGKEYNGWILLWIWTISLFNAFYSLTSNYLRAIDKITIMVKGSVINSIILLSLNIIMIAWLKIGISGYLMATVIGLFFSCIYMLFNAQLIKNSSIKKVKISKSKAKSMISYSFPLIFTAISWWINSSLDRYFVTILCGVEANGIYSIAYKIPNLLVAVQTIFTQAWSISAVQEFDKNDTDGFLGETYEIFSSFMLFVCMLIMVLNIPLSKILYANEFFEAWRYVPYLLCATFFGALSGYYGGIFSAVKNSTMCAISTTLSAVVNILLNYLFIPQYGVSGAAGATLIAYFISYLFRCIAARKYIKLKINIAKIIISYSLLIVQLFSSLKQNHLYGIQIIAILIVFFMYRKLLFGFIKGTLNYIIFKVKNPNTQ